MSDPYGEFVGALGALLKLVVLAALLERVLAFVFEHDWFQRVFTKRNASGGGRDSRFPGLKASLALSLSIGIGVVYEFDILRVILDGGQQGDVQLIGIVVTGFVVAGGTAGAITVFQAYLKFGKETRDAMVAAGQEEASLKEAEAKRRQAEEKEKQAVAERKEAEERAKQAAAERKEEEEKAKQAAAKPVVT